MKHINTFRINLNPIQGKGESRTYTVEGDENAAFSMVILNEDGHYYNFPENTIVNEQLDVSSPSGSFSATPTRLFEKTIGSSGTHTGTIQFPSVSDDDEYYIILQADATSETFFSPGLSGADNSNESIHRVQKINQYLDTTLTFSLNSTSSSGTYNTLPSNYTSTGISSVVTRNIFNSKFSISWAVSLSSSQFIIARQPVINDFYFTTTKDTLTAASSSTRLELKDIKGLSIGMGVTGTGIASNSTIVSIFNGYKDENKSTPLNHVYTVPLTAEDDTTVPGTVIINNSSTFVADRTITFKGYGANGADKFNSTNFQINNFKLVIDPVVTTTDAAVDNSTTIPIASTDGIKVADTVLMTGIGITSSSPHVDAVSSGVNITASSTQTIEDGQTVTFTGSSRTGTITGDVVVQTFGEDNLTLTLELDNILTVG